VAGVEEQPVMSMGDCLRLMQLGEQNRQVSRDATVRCTKPSCPLPPFGTDPVVMEDFARFAAGGVASFLGVIAGSTHVVKC